MGTSPEQRAAERSQLLAERLGQGPATALFLATRALGLDGPETDLSPHLAALAVSSGLVDSRPDGSGVLTPVVQAFLIDEDPSLSREVHELSVPVLGVDEWQTVQIARILAASATLLELVTPSSSVVAVHAAGAMRMLGLHPLLLNLAGLTLDDLRDELLPRLFLEARMYDLGLILINLPDPSPDRHPDVWTALGRLDWPTVVLVDRRHRTRTPRPSFASLALDDNGQRSRELAWLALLPDETTASELAGLAALPLNVVQMYEVWERARTLGAAEDREVQARDVLREGEMLLTAAIAPLAELRTAKTAFEELVFDEALTGALEQVIRSAARARALGPRGSGLKVVFSGPSGTGKTATAEAMGHAIGAPVLYVELSRVIDKYIGETEKNLDRLLTDARRSGAILLFDEGEALFGARGKGDDAGSHFQNMQTSYLLARIEQHSGIVVVASNFPGAMDRAFLRRFQYSVTFRAPSAELRTELWRRSFARYDIVIDDYRLLSRYELPGGAVANVAYLASLTDAWRSPESLVDLIRAEHSRLGMRMP